MPVIARVGRRSKKIKWLILSVYLVLIFGSVMTVYPFLLMLSGSIATNSTSFEYRLIPRYLYDERGLYEAHLYLKYYRYGGIDDIWRQWKIEFPIHGLDNKWRKIPGYRPGADNPIGETLATYFCVDPYNQFAQKYEAIGSPEGWTEAFRNAVALHFPFAVEAVEALVTSAPHFMLERSAFIDRVKTAFLNHLGGFANEYDQLGRPHPGSEEYTALLDRYPVLGENRYFRAAMREYLYCRKPNLADARVRRQIDDYYEFCSKLPMALRDAYYFGGYHRQFEGDLLFQSWAKRRYKTLEAINDAYRNDLTTWVLLTEPYDNLHNQSTYVEDTPQYRDWYDWKAQANVRFIRPAVTEYFWSKFLERRYDNDLEMLNSAYGTDHLRFFDVPLVERLPDREAQRTDWADFVRQRLAPRYIRFDIDHELWACYLLDHFGSLEQINEKLKRSWQTIDQIQLPDLQEKAVGHPPTKREYDLIVKFVTHKCPLDQIRLETPENLYRRYLRDQYGSVASLNQAYGINIRAFDELYLPAPAVDWKEMDENRSHVRWFTFKRSYAHVIDHIVHNRRSLWNTAVFCTAVVLCALVVNPLCAYALSRFNLPGAYKILLFLLATMAFPAEVTMIPNFLLLKSFPLLRVVCCIVGGLVGGVVAGTMTPSKRVVYPFIGAAAGALLGLTFVPEAIGYLFNVDGHVSLLNTYWALVLPSVVSGYAVFILKGFFDSLPQELYESAVIDGASELRIFARITLPMSKPVLAVISLWSFTAAYGSFTWAFVICQDPDMWTLMVHLYQYLMVYGPADGMAALTLASIPTLIVFLAVQKVILRGIILPTYK